MFENFVGQYMLKRIMIDLIKVNPVGIYDTEEGFIVEYTTKDKELHEAEVEIEGTSLVFTCKKIYSYENEEDINDKEKLTEKICYGVPMNEIIFIDEKKDKKPILIDRYSLRSDDGNELGGDKFQIFKINVAYFDGFKYTKEELAKLSAFEKMCLALRTRTRKEMDKLVASDIRLLSFKAAYEAISNDEEFMKEYIKDEEERYNKAFNQND